jgi:hypothetical protein
VTRLLPANSGRPAGNDPVAGREYLKTGRKVFFMVTIDRSGLGKLAVRPAFLDNLNKIKKITGSKSLDLDL